jgi:hypothetical protein
MNKQIEFSQLKSVAQTLASSGEFELAMAHILQASPLTRHIISNESTVPATPLNLHQDDDHKYILLAIEVL